MITIKLTTPLRPIMPNKIMGNTKTKIAKAFREIAPVAKADIKSELRSPNKTGTPKSAARLARYRSSPVRRSAVGESLARDTGASERLISSSANVNKLSVGFLVDPRGDNYVAAHERAPINRHRPTVSSSMARSLPKIESIMNRNIKL